MPKPPELRQRRNKTTTASVLSEVSSRRVRRPKLPDRHVLRDVFGEVEDGEGKVKLMVVAQEDVVLPWHELTLSWWKDVWRSPMAVEYLQADVVPGLFILANLIDEYWKRPSTTLAAEIRQQRMPFGLTPIDRRRLQWEIQRTEERKPAKVTAPREAVSDPRLRALK